MACHFISDLHLSPQTPKLIEGFSTFLDTIPNNDSLYILGDFFDAWIGDDETVAEYRGIQHLLKMKTDAGLKAYFMSGNRDFTVGKTFANQTGLTLLPDPSKIELYGKTYLLMHGDSLCTEDKQYMRFRTFIRHPFVLGTLLALPLKWRRKIADALRGKSKEANAYKKMDIMDVTEEAVTEAIKNAGVQTLIHGHTHRPARHKQNDYERVVLGDWGATGWVFSITEEGSELKEFKL